MAIAIERGRATMATVSPATASARRSLSPYRSLRMVTSFGVNRSTKLGSAVRALIGPGLLRGLRSGDRRVARLARVPGFAREMHGPLGFHEADPTPGAVAEPILAEHLDAEPLESLDDLHEGVDDAPDVALACFHALDGLQRHPGGLRELLLVHPEQCPGGAHLHRRDHN